MPTSPTSICRDCSSRALQGSKYCSSHQTINNNTQHKRDYDRFVKAKDPIRKLYRNKRWAATRLIVIKRDILCVACGHEAGSDVDHIISARLIVERYGVDEFYNPQRLQLLCHDCHSIKTINESSWAGKRKIPTV